MFWALWAPWRLRDVLCWASFSLRVSAPSGICCTGLATRAGFLSCSLTWKWLIIVTFSLIRVYFVGSSHQLTFVTSFPLPLCFAGHGARGVLRCVSPLPVCSPLPTVQSRWSGVEPRGLSLLLSHSSHRWLGNLSLLTPSRVTKAHPLLLTSLLLHRSLLWFAPLAH